MTYKLPNAPPHVFTPGGKRDDVYKEAASATPRPSQFLLRSREAWLMAELWFETDQVMNKIG